MDALEAKTCENRRFWGRFQKDLIVWKLGISYSPITRVDLVSEGLNSVETHPDLYLSLFHLLVSEGLNSVETYTLFIYHTRLI